MTMMRMPGVRDRVVRVLLQEGEGGVNIRMTPEDIDNLAKNYGKAAAREFIVKFATDDSGWLEHRWVRFNRLLISLRRQVEGFAFAAGLDRHAQPLNARILEARSTAPLRGPSHGTPSASEIELTQRQADELIGLLRELEQLEAVYGTVGDNEPYRAVPRPSLRVRHPT